MHRARPFLGLQKPSLRDLSKHRLRSPLLIARQGKPSVWRAHPASLRRVASRATPAPHPHSGALLQLRRCRARVLRCRTKLAMAVKPKVKYQEALCLRRTWRPD
eukprot:scaffold8287_cov36-Tisochrysis_lutea.AAC.9